MNKKTGGATPEPGSHDPKREVEREPPRSTPATPKDKQQGPYDDPQRRPA